MSTSLHAHGVDCTAVETCISFNVVFNLATFQVRRISYDNVETPTVHYAIAF